MLQFYASPPPTEASQSPMSPSPMPNTVLSNGRSSLDYFYCWSGAQSRESPAHLTVVAATVSLVWYK